jgi:DNA processing protein
MYTLSQEEFTQIKPSLVHVDKPPQQLFIESKLTRSQVVEVLARPSVAVVGTRRPTSYGVFATQKITAEICELSSNKVPIVSGFMYGIDQTAHQATYKSGGTIIAVLAHGFSCIPRRHKRFVESILDQGGIFVSEYTPDLPPQKFMFIARNRIVAALSEVIVVPEAAINSGSMHTVRYGLDLGHTIAAVPGLITNPYADGTKTLLNQGATLVSSGQEVLELTCNLQKVLQEIPSIKLTADTKIESQEGTKNTVTSKILAELKAQPRSVNALSELLKISLLDASTELSYLELQGHVSQVNGEWVLQYRR